MELSLLLLSCPLSGAAWSPEHIDPLLFLGDVLKLPPIDLKGQLCFLFISSNLELIPASHRMTGHLRELLQSLQGHISREESKSLKLEIPVPFDIEITVLPMLNSDLKFLPLFHFEGVQNET